MYLEESIGAGDSDKDLWWLPWPLGKEESSALNCRETTPTDTAMIAQAFVIDPFSPHRGMPCVVTWMNAVPGRSQLSLLIVVPDDYCSRSGSHLTWHLEKRMMNAFM
jgi:hypothetical protein